MAQAWIINAKKPGKFTFLFLVHVADVKLSFNGTFLAANISAPNMRGDF